MKVFKVLILVGILSSFALAFFTYYHEGQFEMASKKPKTDRKTELGEAKNKTTKLEDEPVVILNDPAIAQNWGISKVNAQKAWTITKGSKNIVVAVIDTGCDIRHEDLSNNIWRNPGETGRDSKGRDKATNGIDDDGNGLIDDVNGWNFATVDTFGTIDDKRGNNDLTDNHGHGTHIAGIIGAEAGNGKGIAGIAPDVTIMCVKYFDPKVPTADNLKNTIAAIHYAVKMKANIINYSGGGTEYSQGEHDAIEEARQAGILFVAAAGNERTDSDKNGYYPADYKLSNIISVTAIDPSVTVLPSSNYGVNTVDIAAPGQNIMSLLPNNSYGHMTGTSQATAFVTGAAVLVMAKKGITDPEKVKKYIISTGDVDNKLISKTGKYSKLNLYRALTSEDEDVAPSGTKVTPVQEKFTTQGKPKDIKDDANGFKDFLERQQILRSANESDGKK